MRIRLRWDNNSGGGDVGTLGNRCRSIGHQKGCNLMKIYHYPTMRMRRDVYLVLTMMKTLTLMLYSNMMQNHDR